MFNTLKSKLLVIMAVLMLKFTIVAAGCEEEPMEEPEPEDELKEDKEKEGQVVEFIEVV